MAEVDSTASQRFMQELMQRMSMSWEVRNKLGNIGYHSKKSLQHETAVLVCHE